MNCRFSARDRSPVLYTCSGAQRWIRSALRAEVRRSTRGFRELAVPAILRTLLRVLAVAPVVSFRGFSNARNESDGAHVRTLVMDATKSSSVLPTVCLSGPHSKRLQYVWKNTGPILLLGRSNHSRHFDSTQQPLRARLFHPQVRRASSSASKP